MQLNAQGVNEARLSSRLIEFRHKLFKTRRERLLKGGTCGFILQTERRTKIRNKNVAIRVVFS